MSGLIRVLGSSIQAHLVCQFATGRMSYCDFLYMSTTISKSLRWLIALLGTLILECPPLCKPLRSPDSGWSVLYTSTSPASESFFVWFLVCHRFSQYLRQAYSCSPRMTLNFQSSGVLGLQAYNIIPDLYRDGI